MKEKYEIFSEEEYVSKIQLKNMYQNSAADMIYEEIKRNRMMYQYFLTFSERPYYVTMNTTLIKKITRLYEVDTSIIQQENLLISKQYSLLEWITQYEVLNKISLKKEFKHFLCSDEPIVLKVFILYYLEVKKDIIYHYLQYYYKDHWLVILEKVDKKIVENKEILDLTYELRNFLDIFFLHLTSKMVTWTSRRFHNDRVKDELVQLFPQLNVKTIEFYWNHSNAQKHYTVEQYQSYCNVSYETARQAMQKLACLRLYQRFKIGKKYVYMPML